MDSVQDGNRVLRGATAGSPPSHRPRAPKRGPPVVTVNDDSGSDGGDSDVVWTYAVERHTDSAAGTAGRGDGQSAVRSGTRCRRAGPPSQPTQTEQQPHHDYQRHHHHHHQQQQQQQQQQEQQHNRVPPRHSAASAAHTGGFTGSSSCGGAGPGANRRPAAKRGPYNKANRCSAGPAAAAAAGAVPPGAAAPLSTPTPPVAAAAAAQLAQLLVPALKYVNLQEENVKLRKRSQETQIALESIQKLSRTVLATASAVSGGGDASVTGSDSGQRSQLVPGDAEFEVERFATDPVQPVGIAGCVQLSRARCTSHPLPLLYFQPEVNGALLWGRGTGEGGDTSPQQETAAGGGTQEDGGVAVLSEDAAGPSAAASTASSKQRAPPSVIPNLAAKMEKAGRMPYKLRKQQFQGLLRQPAARFGQLGTANPKGNLMLTAADIAAILLDLFPASMKKPTPDPQLASKLDSAPALEEEEWREN
ncbi:hypothetical protein HYH02_005218 [Chlamydomonas schloesseri]|uniref:Uncharacterized protein n=1 Tax=Chlamydomonas schloesseri TaxID=2026947 RepID=A0A836B7D7_9CHLO|nr:hypothetical protein HYH02_005218 [Chlamydomonas schloesseri]|eukprot:KAG2449690.1 hypothetical protein HYH02_005218 [Chlamydomonas schloesseri]